MWYDLGNIINKEAFTMITYSSIYLIAKDFEKSMNKTRFAVFDTSGLTLSIMNGRFDTAHPDEVITKGERCAFYDDMVAITESANCGKVVINLNSDDLQAEYERIKSLHIGSNLTKIRCINAGNPYYYFCLKDPDDNTIEITGSYHGKIDE